MSLTPAGLDNLMHGILVQLELASITPAAKLHADIVHGGHGHGAPQPIDAPHLRLRAQYDRAQSIDDHRTVIDAALEELRGLRYAKRGNVQLGTVDGRLQVGRDPRPARIVGHVYGYSERQIYRLRKLAREHDSRSASRSSTLTSLSVSTRAPSGPERRLRAA